MPHALPHRLLDNPAVQENFEEIEDLLQEVNTIKSLPPKPSDGQTVFFQNTAMANKSVTWQLRYNGGSPFGEKWEFIGGNDFPSEEAAALEWAAEAGVLKPLAGGNLTVPFQGVYRVGFQCYGQLKEKAITEILAGITVNGAFGLTLYEAVMHETFDRMKTYTVGYAGLAKGDVVASFGKCQQPTKVIVVGARIFLTPLRVA